MNVLDVKKSDVYSFHEDSNSDLSSVSSKNSDDPSYIPSSSTSTVETDETSKNVSNCMWVILG